MTVLALILVIEHVISYYLVASLVLAVLNSGVMKVCKAKIFN